MDQMGMIGIRGAGSAPSIRSVEWKKLTLMVRECRWSTCLVLSVALALYGSAPARAFDPNAGVSKESGPFTLFKFGFSAYKNGRKDEAVEAYRYAAEKGHTASRWALANMYADGDGVAENDLEAFKIYSEIARRASSRARRIPAISSMR